MHNHLRRREFDIQILPTQDGKITHLNPHINSKNKSSEETSKTRIDKNSCATYISRSERLKERDSGNRRDFVTN